MCSNFPSSANICVFEMQLFHCKNSQIYHEIKHSIQYFKVILCQGDYYGFFINTLASEAAAVEVVSGQLSTVTIFSKQKSLLQFVMLYIGVQEVIPGARIKVSIFSFGRCWEILI